MAYIEIEMLEEIKKDIKKLKINLDDEKNKEKLEKINNQIKLLKKQIKSRIGDFALMRA